jgi:hypothetical protein
MNVVKKNSYTLHKINTNTKTTFSLIKKNLPTSIFSTFNNIFFKKIIKKKIISSFVIKNKKKKISAIITVVVLNNFSKLKYNIFLFFLTNPFFFLLNIIKIFKSLTRGPNTSFDNSYLHLLHLIIYKKCFNKISIKKKDQIINFFFTHILKIFNAKSFFLCYERNNLKAKNFYSRNNFLVYDRKNKIVFLKKKLR